MQATGAGQTQVSRFNLIFSGEIIEGHDPQEVQARLAQALELTHADLLRRYFCGKPVVLAHDLARKEGTELYARMRRLGIHTELVSTGQQEAREAGTHAGADSPAAFLALAIATANPAAMAGPKPAVQEEEEAVRRADLAVSKSLRPDEAALLESKEKALQKALRARQKEQARHSKADRETKGQAGAGKRAGQSRPGAASGAAEPAPKQAQAPARLEAAPLDPQALEPEPVAAGAGAERARRKEGQGLAAGGAALPQAAHETARGAGRSQEKKSRRNREQALEVARRRLEQARAKAAQKASEREQKAQRGALEDQAIRRAAVELAQKPSLKPVEARVRTRLETPTRQRAQAPAEGEVRRKRQPGAPNLYSLRPFRNTPDIRARAGQSRRIKRRAFGAAAIAAAAAIVLGAVLPSLRPPALPGGTSGIAVDLRQQPLLLADEFLLRLDRSGVSISELALGDLGLTTLAAPMAFNAAGELLAPGRLAGPAEPAGAAPQLLRCTLAEPGCAVFSAELAGTVISALAVHPIDGNLFIADSSAGQLLKVSPDGAVLARAAAELPAQPALALDSGLLLVTSASATAIRVVRYEDEAFGQQLDEIALPMPAAGNAESASVSAFLWHDGYWWVLRDQGDTGGARLYRYDSRWQYIDSPALAPGSRPRQLVGWGRRILAVDPARIPIQRFSSEGAPETPLVPDSLASLRSAQEHRASLVLLGWRICLALCLLAAAAGLCLGWLHRARSLVYTSCRERGAEPVDELVDSFDWIEIAPNRGASLGTRGRIYAAAAAAIVAGAIGLGASALQLSALLLALAGPAVALLLLQRSEPGHMGVSGDRLLLVDHDGMYHVGSGSRIHHRGPFLMIDDVTVFAGSRLLPAFVPGAVEASVKPLAATGVKVDRTMLAVKLLQGRHPLALGAVAIAAASAGALALLSLHGIF
jgi:hypothetical protein